MRQKNSSLPNGSTVSDVIRYIRLNIVQSPPRLVEICACSRKLSLYFIYSVKNYDIRLNA